MKLKRKSQYQALKPLVVGPMRGARMTRDPMGTDPHLAAILYNMYPVDTEKLSDLVGRPGVRALGAQIGSGSSRGQAVHQFTKLDGTEISMVIFAGEIWTINWSTRVSTRVVTAANIVTAGCALATSGIVYCITFANTVVISKAGAQPFTWDGSSGAGGLTLLTNTNALGWAGQPTVYYGKLFGVLSDSRTTFEWSEENQPNLGYLSGIYTNRWTFGQTDQEAIYCLVGTNEQLLVFRQRSTSAISGAVTPDFRSAGTHESISSTIGMGSLGGGCFRNGDLHFLSADSRPMIFRPGAGILEVWADHAETTDQLNTQLTPTACSIYDPMTDMVLHAAANAGETLYHQMMVMAGEQPSGIWKGINTGLTSGWRFETAGMLKNVNGKPVLVHLTQDGIIYDHGLPSTVAGEFVWSDETATVAATQPINHTMYGPYSGWDEAYEKIFYQVDVSLRSAGNPTGVFLGIGASHIESGLSTVSVGAFAGITDEHHAALGCLAVGRWGQIQLFHAATDDQFGFIGGRIRAKVRGLFPNTT